MAITLTKRLEKGASLTFLEGDNNLKELEDLSSIENGKGASQIGVEDASGLFTATNVEGVLEELGNNAGGGGGIVSRALISTFSESIPQGGNDEELQWSNVVHDNGNYFSFANPSVVTVPAGVNFVELTIAFEPSNTPISGLIFTRLSLNSSFSSAIDGLPAVQWLATDETKALQMTSGLIFVTPGDVFSLTTRNFSNAPYTVSKAWLSIKGYNL